MLTFMSQDLNNRQKIHRAKRRGAIHRALFLSKAFRPFWGSDFLTVGLEESSCLKQERFEYILQLGPYKL
jgi:hypothetical protein